MSDLTLADDLRLLAAETRESARRLAADQFPDLCRRGLDGPAVARLLASHARLLVEHAAALEQLAEAADVMTALEGESP